MSEVYKEFQTLFTMGKKNINVVKQKVIALAVWKDIRCFQNIGCL
jgi:hypothetical protein